METTLNMHVDILKQITRAAEFNGISRSEMIIRLIKKAMHDISNPTCMGRMVQYQQRRKFEEWHTFHVRLREDDYEYFLDLRKLLKMSVSLILAYAVDRYLIQLMKTNTTDNYRFTNYVIVKEIIENTICWRFFWGYPPNLEKYL